MLSFLHTADWQIGMKARRVARVAEKVRAARLETASRLTRLAVERRVDFVVIAGDVFEDNLVSLEDVHRVLRILSECAPIPVFILPGNHDPLTPDSVYNRSAFRESPPPNVHVFRSREPVRPVPGVVLLPAPLEAKEGFDDPTDGLGPAPGREEGVIAVGVAHGSLRIPNKFQPNDFPIALDAPERHGLDYLALGHWHSFYVHGSRAAYPGTPEPTGFPDEAGEASGTGTAALVTIDGPGRPPRVERLSTATLQWSNVRADIAGGGGTQGGGAQGGDASAQVRRVAEAIPGAGRTLLRLVLEGRSPLDDPAWLENLQAWLDTRFLYAEVDTSRVLTGGATARLMAAATADQFLAALVSDLDVAAQIVSGGRAPGGGRAGGPTGGSAGPLPDRPDPAVLQMLIEKGVGPEDVQEALRMLTALGQEVFR